MIVLIVAAPLIALPWGCWLAYWLLASDTTLLPAGVLELRTAWRPLAPGAAVFVAGMGWWLTAWWPLLIVAALAYLLAAWHAWQALLAVWGAGIVYLLRRDDSCGNYSGSVVYIGNTGRDWAARKREHMDDRNPGWKDWKADVDWTISGPAWRRTTKKSAARLELRMIRMFAYADRIARCDPIENEAATKLRGPAHPLLAARWWWYRAQGVLIPARAVRLEPAAVVESPGPAGLPVRQTPIEDMPQVVEAEGVLSSAARARRPAADQPAADSAPADPEASPDPSAVDQPGPDVEPVSSDEDDASRVSPPVSDPTSHVSQRTPFGGSCEWDEIPPEGETPDETDAGGETDDEGAELVDTGVADEAAEWLARESRRAPRPKARRAKKGGRSAPRGREIPPWVAGARRARAAEGLSYDALVGRLAAEGVAVSRSTVARWCRDE